ncbi:MAG: glycosyl hydrolase [Cytophagaceae bacterium]|nr:glycosyl hydrolase [Cytophagaceae bacterium]
MKNIFLLTLLFISNVYVSAQVQFPSGTPGVGGSYNLTYPPEPCADPGGCLFDLYNQIGGGAVGAMTKGPNYQGPFQTHNWWNSALWDAGMAPCIGDLNVTFSMHSGVIRPFPAMHLEATEQGQVVRHREKALNQGGPNNTGSGFADQDIIVGLLNNAANNFYTCSRTDVDDYGDMHVRMRQDFGGGNILNTTASSGCPFVFFENSGSANMSFFLWFMRCTAVSSTGNAITIHRSISYADFNQRQYGLFFPPGTTISANNGATYVPFTSIPHNGMAEWGGNNRYFRLNFPAGQKYFVVAVLPDTSRATLELYEQYAFNKITDSRFTYQYNEATATVRADFACTTTNVLGATNTGTLMAQYLHQYRHSPQHPANFTGREYITARGIMRVCRGNTFSVEMKNYGFLPALGYANTANKAQLSTFVQNYAFGRGFINIACGTPVYGSLGSIHEAARIAEIAHAVGNYPARNRLLAIVRNGLDQWLTSLNGEYAGMYHYDPTFNWLTPFPSAFDADRLLQDSHFHHGYLVYAAAIYARFESVLGNGNTWATQWGPMINLVIRNINDYQRNMNSPGVNAPWFPYLRYFDPYAGHSWAGHDASNQESVSESINFAAGCALWGETTGNTAIRDMGVMMYVLETEAARLYWWDGERLGINRGAFAPNFNHYHIAILGSDGGAYATFFGADRHYVHGITYVPITGSSLWMGVDSMGAANQQADFQSMGGPTNGSAGFWSTVMLMQQATYDAANAKTRFLNEAVPGNWGGNDYRADGLYWISTFDSVGVVDATVQADITSFGVFRKDNCKHYMVYMPPGKGPRMVNFSDGRSFMVPADTIITYKVCSIPLPVHSVWLEGVRKTNRNILTFHAAKTGELERYTLQVSRHGKGFEDLGTWQETEERNGHIVFRWTDDMEGTAIYRVKIEGDVTFYSNAVRLSSDANSIALFPNPAETQVLCQYSEIPLSVSVMDITGKEVYRCTNVPSQELNISLESFSKGMYTVQAQFTSRVWTSKLVVR